ncbi:hypothetical protein [Algoriphagus yeomjeoni]|uniref:Uncharacterized protein n=1 Tax=Algoriphagus yeomjeoni TaxID=291403 RepID=A0A327P021_9BACT|nr:hypothetical protein [Algoriphagus yeomjeoni]RAI85580.1 hypothetical protein LV83_03660 [Algoriphagus yeomjeoni]
MEVVISVCVYFLIVLGILSVQFNNEVKFENVVVSYLFIVSSYAIIKTSGHTLYWVPLILVIVSIFKGQYKVRLSRPKFGDIVAAGVIWLIFFGLYFILNDFKFGVYHEDYIIYSRIAHYNDIVGVENTKSVYNFFQSGLRNEIYHFTELWGIAFLRYFTSLSLLINYVFVLGPIFSFIIYLGFRQVYSSYSFVIALLSVFCILFISSPYDKIVSVIGVDLPMLGVGDTILSIKNIFIIPVFLYLFVSLRDRNFSFLIFSILVFLYPLIIPVVLPAVCMYFFLVHKYSLKFYLYPLLVLIFFFLYSLYLSTGTQFADIYNFNNYKILLKVIFIGLFIGTSIFVFNWKYFDNDKLKQQYYLISLVVILTSLILWVLFYQNINSNQFFRNVFHSLLCIQVTFLIVESIVNKKLIFSFVFICVFIIPFYLNDFKFVSVPNLDNVNFKSSLKKNSNILFIPDVNKDRSIYDYIDYMYYDLNKLHFKREYLNVLSVSSAFPVSKKIDSESELSMLNSYRNSSPLFNYCGEIDLSNLDCLIEFSLDNDIDYIVSSINNGSLMDCYSDILFDQYYIYSANCFILLN